MYFCAILPVPPVLTSPNKSVGIFQDNLTIRFEISAAVPKVSGNDILWFYSNNSSINISNFDAESVEDITNRTTRTNGKSSLTFSPDLKSLTISSTVQAVGTESETDQGRYFIRVSNPAGVDVAFVDVVIEGEFMFSVE